MKTFRSIAAVFVFAAVFAVSAFAQAPGAAQTAGVAKIVVIDTGAFGGTDDKGTGGITKYVAAQNALEAEFKTVQADLQAIATKIQNLEADIQKLQAAKPNPGVPVKSDTQTTLQAKVDEYQALQVEFKRKQEDAKAKFERRQAVVMGPVMQDIYKSLQDFTTQKGYDLILDAAKLDAGQLILGFNPAKVDVTKEFITFYNARPGTTATTAAPK